MFQKPLRSPLSINRSQQSLYIPQLIGEPIKIPNNITSRLSQSAYDTNGYAARTISLKKNETYLSLAVVYFSRVVTGPDFDLQTLYNLIRKADFLVVSNPESIPRRYKGYYDSTCITNYLIALLNRISEKKRNKERVYEFVINTVNNEILAQFCCILLMRYLAHKLLVKDQAQTQYFYLFKKRIQLKSVTDFQRDAQNNTARLLSDATDVRIVQYHELNDAVPNNPQSKSSFVRVEYGSSLCKESVQILKLDQQVYLLQRLSNSYAQASFVSGLLTVFQSNISLHSDTTPDAHHKQKILWLPQKQIQTPSLSKISSSVSADIRDHNSSLNPSIRVNAHRLCNRCGRIKLQRFCICRKERRVKNQLSLENSDWQNLPMLSPNNISAVSTARGIAGCISNKVVESQMLLRSCQDVLDQKGRRLKFVRKNY